MKTKTNNHPLSLIPDRRSLMKLALSLSIFAGLAAVPLNAQSQYRAGYNEDEWYDPGDWFDGNNYERDGSDQYGWDDNNTWDESYADNNLDTYDSSTTNTTVSDNNTNGVVSSPYYYYWDPVVIGWTTTDPADTKANSQANNKQNKNQQQSGAKDMTTFQGKVDGFRKVDLQTRDGKNEQHSFVRVRLKNGDARVVSLGTRVNMSDLDLEKGDKISVSGKNARIDNRDVLVAKQIQVADQTFRIKEKNRPQIGESVSIDGTIKDFKKTSLDGSREQNLIVRMELQSGKQCVVDLGRGTTLQELDLERGSEVKLEGRKTQVDGKNIIVAQKIRIDGDATRIRDKSVSNTENVNTRSSSAVDNDYTTAPSNKRNDPADKDGSKRHDMDDSKSYDSQDETMND